MKRLMTINAPALSALISTIVQETLFAQDERRLFDRLSVELDAARRGEDYDGIRAAVEDIEMIAENTTCAVLRERALILVAEAFDPVR